MGKLMDEKERQVKLALEQKKSSSNLPAMKGLCTQKVAENSFMPGQAILCESGFSQYGGGSSYAQAGKKSPKS